MKHAPAASRMLRLGEILEEFDERLGRREEPEVLTLTEKNGFIAQRKRFKKRLAVANTCDYKFIGLHDIAFNPYLLWAGAVAQNTEWEAAIISPLYPTFRVRAGHDPRFVSYVLHSGAMRARYDGIAFGSVPRKRRTAVADFLGLSIPEPPPLPEQRRIAEILDKADALRAKRHAALVQLDTLAQSIFVDMFGDPATNPKGWPLRLVADYVAGFRGGKSIEADIEDNAATRNRVLKVSAVTTMKYLPGKSKPVPDSYEPPAEHFVRAGDLLFSRANTTQLVGAVAFVEDTPPHFLLPDKLWRFVWREPLLADPVFVWALFQTEMIRGEIGRRATGTSASMKNISHEKVLSIRTILPPLDTQRDFARRMKALERLKSTYRASRITCDALFASLQQCAFRGEL